MTHYDMGYGKAAINDDVKMEHGYATCYIARWSV